MKEKRISWSILGTAFAFMLCVFAPIDAYFANKGEFWFSFEQIIPIIVVAFLISSILFVGIGLLLSKCNSIFCYFYDIVVGLFLFFYIQGNYVPRNYGVLNGESIDWKSYTGYRIASIVLLLLSIFLMVLLVTKLKTKLYDIGKYVALFVFLIQVVTLFTVILQDNMKSGSDSENTSRIVSQDKVFNLSSEGNVIVFLLDTFQAEDFRTLMEGEQKEECEVLFENFVFYPDTLGMYPTTKASLPYILTGVTYQNEQPFSEYVQEAYVNNPVYEAMKQNDYSNGTYTNSLYLSNDTTLYENVYEGDYVINNHKAFASKLYKLVAFNYMPHQLKRLFFTDTSEFADLKKSLDDKQPFSTDVVTFYNSLKSMSISVDQDKKCFRFYHLDGVHAPYTFGADLTSKSNEEYDVLDEAKGNFTLLSYYFDELKKQGVYDNSTIVILADHGHVDYAQNPLFMIKNAGENHELRVSDASMSYEYLDEIFASLLNGETVGESEISAMKPEDGEYRRFLYYTWDNAWDRDYMPGMQEFYSKGLASDSQAMFPTGQSFSADDADYAYELGTTLDFFEGKSGYLYCKYGVGHGRGAYGNVSQKAEFEFDLKGKYKNILTSITLNSVSGCGNVDIYANGKLVGEFYYGEKDSLEFIVPNDYIIDDKLSLLFLQTTQENDTQAILASSKLNLDQMVLTSTNEAMDFEKQNQAFVYEPGTVLDEQNGIAQYAMDGVYDFDGSNCWTSGKIVDFFFKIPTYEKDMTLSLECLTFDGNQTVCVYANGEKIDEFLANGETKRTITIPAAIVQSGVIQITLDLPDARSPESLGQSVDARELALALKKIVLE